MASARTRACEHQQMLNDGWISELELQFSGPSPSEPIFDLEEDAAPQCAVNSMNLWEHGFQENWCAQESEKRSNSTRWSSRSEAKRRSIAVVPIKLVVTDKRDPDRPKVRCRLVGMALASKDERNLLRARTLQ